MKAKERHQLKQNEVAETAARLMGTLSTHQGLVGKILGGLVVIGLLVGGVMFWRSGQNDRAGEQLGIALALMDATIAPAPTIPGAAQAAGTFPSEQARAEAALSAFQKVAADYPSTDAGLAARYHSAGELMALGRLPDAEQAFQKVAADAGSSIYGPMARLGLADVMFAAGKHDEAIKTFTALSAERDSALPVDGVLMQLARVCLKAGKTDEARAAFKRVVDEFPDSVYLADAQQRLTALN